VQPRTIPVDTIRAIDVASHPFDDMLEASDGPLRRVPLAKSVPQDRFFAWFRDLAALESTLDGAAE